MPDSLVRSIAREWVPPPKEVHDEFGLLPVFPCYPAGLVHVAEEPIDMKFFKGRNFSTSSKVQA